MLHRLHAAGEQGWRDDPEAADLMRYAMDKYGALARKHHLEPEDAAVAAFEVMRSRAARNADDSWAVVTRAVQVTLIAEERANGLLCSTHQARRPQVSAHHDAERFSDRDVALIDYHPAFQVAAEQDDVGTPAETGVEPTGAWQAAEQAVVLFSLLGWPVDTARTGIDYICARVIESGSRSAAHEMLRHDRHACALLDLSRASWAALLRVVLGNQTPDHAHTTAGRGVLLRLLIGHSVAELLTDDALVRTIVTSSPRTIRVSHA
jgi:hypothetical protein